MATDPGSSLKTAQTISVKKTPRIFRNFLGGSDKIDLYTFNLKRTSSFNLSTTKLRANLDVVLLNRRGKALQRSRMPGRQAEAISTTLTPGTYYIRVDSRERKSFAYRLSLSTQNTSPIVSVTPDLKINQGTTVVISNGVLRAIDREQSSSQVVYTLSSSPRSGKLFLNDVELGVGSTFTQADIDSNRLTYGQQRQLSQLTNNNTNDLAGDIDGSNVVWTGSEQNSDSEVFFFDGSTGGTTPLTNNENAQDFATGVFGADAVWTDTTSFRGFFYNGATKETSQVTSGVNINGIPGLSIDIARDISNGFILLNSVDQVPPNAANALANLFASNTNDVTRLFFEVARLVDIEVVLYDTRTGVTTALTNNSAGDVAGGISDGNVVWSGFDGNDFEIFFYNGTTGNTTQLTNNNTDDFLPRVSGSNVVWTGSDGTDEEVFLYNGTTGSITQLTNNNTKDEAGGISGLNVVWTGFDGSDNEVFFYNGTTGGTTPLTNNGTNDLAAGISGPNVIWTGFDGTDDEVFLSGFTPTDTVSFTVSDGLGGLNNGSLNLTIS